MRMIRMMKSSSSNSSSSSMTTTSKVPSTPTIPSMNHYAPTTTTTTTTTISNEEEMEEVSWDAIAQSPIPLPQKHTTRSRSSIDMDTGSTNINRRSSRSISKNSSSTGSRGRRNDLEESSPPTNKSCLSIRVGHSHPSSTTNKNVNNPSSSSSSSFTNRHQRDTVPTGSRNSITTSTSTGTRPNVNALPTKTWNGTSRHHHHHRILPPPPSAQNHVPNHDANGDDDDDDDDHTSEYIDWPGTQNVYGQTIPILNHHSHDDEDDDNHIIWENHSSLLPPVPPSKTILKQAVKKSDHSMIPDVQNRTMNTSATTADSSFQSLLHIEEEPETDFFMGAFQAEQQTKLVYDPTALSSSSSMLLLQQPIPLTRSVDSIAKQRNGSPNINDTNNTIDDTHNNNNNSHFMKGYRGFIEKTKDVPSLFDATADSASDATTTTTTTASPSKTAIATTHTRPANQNHFDEHHHHSKTNDKNNNKSNSNHYDNNYDTETYISDVFDGISLFSSHDDDTKSLSLQQYHQRDKLAHVPKVTYPQRIVEEEDDEDNMNHYVRDNYHPQKNYMPSNSGSHSNTTFQLITLPGTGITTIQTLDNDYRNRYTASSNASNSDIGSYHTTSTTMTPIPDVQKMLQAGHDHDSALHGIYGNIGQSKVATTRNNHYGNTNQQQQQRRDDNHHMNVRFAKHSEANTNYHGSDQNSSYSSSGSQYSVDDPSGLYVDGDYLSEYYIKPSIMKKVLLKYRSISDQCTIQASAAMSPLEYDLLVDERKAFALFEMRSRIMEKDIERQLERRGGSFVVDDIVTTPYHRTAHRIRDAVIVSKAWRDGATISDVIHTALLTRRAEHSYAIPRRTQRPSRTGTTTTVSWEIVEWLDDTDFMHYRCPSLGSRHMHGFEMFTIGDCQSILLKLTNERCNELRHELNLATEMQINAEDLMKEEESENNNADGNLTEAEMTYLSALETVKSISKKLVMAEKSFALVRDRIRTLISRYETMLLKIEAGSYTGASSIISYESSYYSEHDHKQYMKEERVWAKRAMRAEVRAEIAAREALLAKQRAVKIQEEKLREIEELRKKLDELQSENSVASGNEREKNALSNIMSHQNNNQNQSNQSGNISREKLDGVKQRFRDRMAEKKRQTTAANIGMSSSLVSSVQGRAPLHPSSFYQGPRRNVVPPSAQHQAKRELLWSAGEEMFQQMVFYERSLEAVVVDNSTPRTM